MADIYLDVLGVIPCRARFLSSPQQQTLKPAQPPNQLVHKAFSPGTKQQECEADQSPPYSAEVKDGRAILPLSLCLCGLVLKTKLHGLSP
jgi:hypothetical protein